MKVKSHKEIIDGLNTITFFIEDVATNSLIHSDTFIVTRKTRIKELKYNFISYVQDKEKLELALLTAEVHKLKENKVVMDLNNIDIPEYVYDEMFNKHFMSNNSSNNSIN